MPDLDTVRSWEARTMVDRDGTRIGPIQAIYLDDRTGEAEWALVTTGLFGTKASFVPLQGPARGGLKCRSRSRDGFERNARPCGHSGRTGGTGHHVAEADGMARDPLKSGPVGSPRGREAASPRPAAPGAGKR